jgi:hypothetical protein
MESVVQLPWGQPYFVIEAKFQPGKTNLQLTCLQ